MLEEVLFENPWLVAVRVCEPIEVPPAFGGRGTLRPDDIEFLDIGLLAPLALFEGTLRFEAMPLFGRPRVVPGRATPRPPDVLAWFSPAREDEPNEFVLDAAGGVIRLTTGREAMRPGVAAGRPAFRPSLLCIVGLAFTRFNAGAFRTALAGTCTAFWRTDNPPCSVPRETAVNPPRTFMLA